ncbi:hypothetical protein [Salinarimonas ramus]|uniref:Uncharacterized protein n=1 Tax=Salinarimonas ramus TaxID=690164 RepID=A0A917V1Y3_9HYPH|nr:hypothetical protein [Salinarimonas ramus]GGK18003.1 hypothetical protein GCM10011322_00900 [Salinarimonas ramus]
MTIRIAIDSAFVAGARKLPPDRRKGAMAALDKFQREPKLPSLRFRALQGADSYFIINCAHGDRVILRKESDDLFTAVDVGPHDNVYRRWNRT